MHAEYGGVVPELASRDHCSKIVEVLNNALDDIPLESIDKIAYTSGPGLLGALLIGESFAQGLSTALKIPLIPVNHLEGHLMSPMMEFSELQMPFICLLVSGGHSMIVDVKEKGEYEILGQSQDDAVGEAFDKVAKMLDLPYPGGPNIEKLAVSGNPKAYDFPRPMINSNNLDMSVDVLVEKIKKAVKLTNRSSVIIAGGVAANNFLRKEIKNLEDKNGISVYYPSMKYCTDNAAMIAFVGSKMSHEKYDIKSKARARWPLNEL